MRHHEARLSVFLGLALGLGAWCLATLGTTGALAPASQRGLAAIAVTLLAVVWVGSTFLLSSRPDGGPASVLLRSWVLAAAALIFGLEAMAAGQGDFADGRIAAVLAVAVSAIAALVLAARPGLFAWCAAAAIAPLAATKAGGAVPDPTLVGVLAGVTVALIAVHGALASGLRRTLVAEGEQRQRLRRLEEMNQVLSADRMALQAESRTDPLTGLANRRYLEEVLQSEWNRCRRSGASLSCLLVDIDYFKAYNDHYGHDGGDGCLKKVAAVLEDSTRRAGDVVARIGGEEFVLLLPKTGKDGAATVAALLKQAVAETGIPHAKSPLGGGLTISLGVATLVPDEYRSAGELLKAADLALYEAKRTGRNRIVTASDETLDSARMAARGMLG